VIDMPGFDPEATAPVRRPAVHHHPDGPTHAAASSDTPAASRHAPRSAGKPAGDPADPPPAGSPSPAAERPVLPDVTTERPVLPDVTTDERDIGWGELPEPGDDDRYLREVPPHHGG
jgi:hypothetical protein